MCSRFYKHRKDSHQCTAARSVEALYCIQMLSECSFSFMVITFIYYSHTSANNYLNEFFQIITSFHMLTWWPSLCLDWLYFATRWFNLKLWLAKQVRLRGIHFISIAVTSVNHKTLLIVKINKALEKNWGLKGGELLSARVGLIRTTIKINVYKYNLSSHYKKLQLINKIYSARAKNYSLSLKIKYIESRRV